MWKLGIIPDTGVDPQPVASSHHAVPLKRTSVSYLPTAHTSFAPPVQTSRRSFVVTLGTTCQEPAAPPEAPASLLPASDLVDVPPSAEGTPASASPVHSDSVESADVDQFCVP